MKSLFIILFFSIFSLSNCNVEFSSAGMSDTTIIQDVNNKIYFCGPVTQRRFLNLKKAKTQIHNPN